MAGSNTDTYYLVDEGEADPARTRAREDAAYRIGGLRWLETVREPLDPGEGEQAMAEARAAGHPPEPFPAMPDNVDELERKLLE